MYKSIKLKSHTVRDLQKLGSEIGITSLDELINIMLRVTNEHRLVYKRIDWNYNFHVCDKGGESSEGKPF